MTKQSKFFIVNHNLKKLRKAVGLTQVEFSIELKIKRSLLGAYEEHRAELSSDSLLTLIKKGYLLKDQLYSFMFEKNFKPTPTKHYRKVLIEEWVS